MTKYIIKRLLSSVLVLLGVVTITFFVSRVLPSNPATKWAGTRATEAQLAAHGVNVVIHANHLIRSAFPAMQATARSILANGRSKEADALCMSIKEILTLLPNS